MEVSEATFSFWYHGNDIAPAGGHRHPIIFAGPTQRLSPLLHANSGFLGIYVLDNPFNQVVGTTKAIESDKWVHLAITWAAVNGEEGKLYYIWLKNLWITI